MGIYGRNLDNYHIQANFGSKVDQKPTTKEISYLRIDGGIGGIATIVEGFSIGHDGENNNGDFHGWLCWFCLVLAK